MLGCAGMADLAAALSQRFGLPVIEGVGAAVKLVEMLAVLGLRTSKTGGWASPLAKGWAGPYADLAGGGATGRRLIGEVVHFHGNIRGSRCVGIYTPTLNSPPDSASIGRMARPTAARRSGTKAGDTAAARRPRSAKARRPCPGHRSRRARRQSRRHRGCLAGSRGRPFPGQGGRGAALCRRGRHLLRRPRQDRRRVPDPPRRRDRLARSADGASSTTTAGAASPCSRTTPAIVYTIIAWRDLFASWRDEVTKKHAAGVDIARRADRGPRTSSRRPRRRATGPAPPTGSAEGAGRCRSTRPTTPAERLDVLMSADDRRADAARRRPHQPVPLCRANCR